MLRKPAFYMYFVIFFLTVMPILIFSQGATDIYLIEIKVDGEKYDFRQPVKINQTEGYNNQPSFHPDGNSLFYSASGGTNTDIYRYDIATGKTSQLTDTPDSEYSPILMPGGNGFSVIQLVITEGPRKGAQPLLSFPLSSGDPGLIYENGEKVGYHAWIDSQKVAMFVLGSPNFLQIVELKDMSIQHIADNIGRSLYKIPGQGAISFSQSEKGKPEVIMRYDLKSRETRRLVAMLEGNRFYAWSSSGALIMGVGSNLFEFRPGVDQDWQLIGNLSTLGINNISRLAIDSKTKWLAVVNTQ
ncbi:MAG: hypothetical protein GQ544_01060 [Candidatus Aminicenantes bacterium]|nr:hypothetical protein [Candidatus Aminicenantes bacterium]